MEVFNPTRVNENLYRTTITQNGSGTDIDRYIYSNQSGQGLGSFFGNFVRTMVPFLSKAIKGSTSVAKPLLKNVAKELVTAGAKRALAEISGPEAIIHKKHKKHIHTTKRKRRRKWQSL